MNSCHRTVVAKGLPINWFLSYVPYSELRCFEVVRQNYHKSIVILRILLISSDLTWQVYIAKHLVPSESVLLNILFRISCISTIHSEFHVLFSNISRDRVKTMQELSK